VPGGTSGGNVEPGTPGFDEQAGARGGVYGLLAAVFRHPDEALHRTLVDGDLVAGLISLVERTSLPVRVDVGDEATADDFETLCSRYNDLFELGYAEYTDRTDGSLSTTEPPVPLYESAYRCDASWTDVNLDLARAYDYYDLEVDDSDRENHDHLPLQLEFAGFLARREAAVDGSSAAAARLDLLDRHLRILIEGVADRIADEPGTGVYGPLATFLDRFTAADRRDLAERLEVD